MYYVFEQNMIDTQRFTSEKTWDILAPNFDNTRQKPWKIVLDFIQTLPSQSQVIDVGCGNGRHILPCAQHCASVIGFDLSYNLLKIAKNKTQKVQYNNTFFIHGTVTHLPFKDNSFDVILFIAALHNIKERKQRLQSLQEIYRILKPQGCGLISVWSRWQKRYRLYFLKEVILRRQQEFGDIEIPWRQQTSSIPRFYHLYSKSEFGKDITRSGFTLQKMIHEKIKGKPNVNNFFAFIKK